MKPYLLLPFVLLLGLMLGGWGPRSDLRRLKEEVKQTRALLRDARKKQGGSDVKQVTRMLGIESSAPAARPARPRLQQTAENQRETPAADTLDATNTTTEAGTADRRDQRPNTEAELEAAIELWELRSDIARSTFLSNGDFSDQEALAFDVLVEAMNVRLEHTIETWVDTVTGKEQVNAEDGIRLMNEVTGTLVLTYDEMDRKLPDDWRQAAGQELQLMDFINPSVARPLMQAEDQLNQIERSFDDRATEGTP